MADFKIGVIVDSFRLDIKEAVKKAKEVGEVVLLDMM